MAFTADNLVIKNQPVEQPTQTNPVSDNQLDLPELEFLLRVIGQVDLKGHQVEMFYRMVIKLQNQYIERSKK